MHSGLWQNSNQQIHIQRKVFILHQNIKKCMFIFKVKIKYFRYIGTFSPYSLVGYFILKSIKSASICVTK